MNEPAPATSIDIAVLRRRITLLEQLAVRFGCALSALSITVGLLLPLWKSDNDSDWTYTLIAFPFDFLGEEIPDDEAAAVGIPICIALVALIAMIVALLSLCADEARASSVHLVALSMGTFAVVGIWVVTARLAVQVEENIFGFALIPLTMGAGLAIASYQISVVFRGAKPRRNA